MADTDPIITYTISIARNGDVTNDTQCYNSTFAETYRAFYAIRDEVNRQIDERRNCPYNPKQGKVPEFELEFASG